MGLLDRLLGRRPPARRGYGTPPPPPPPGVARSADEQAVERYRYLLRTAPPDQIEQAHAEAFAQLTPEQRRQVLEQLSAAGERPRGADPRDLARAATRAELRRPGILERVFGGYGPGYGGPGYGGGYGGPGYGPGYGGGYGPGYGGGYGGPGFGSVVGGSLLGTIGGLVIGTAVADALFDTGPGDGGLFGGGDEDAYREGFTDGARYDDAGYDGGPGGYDDGGPGGYDGGGDGGYDSGWDGGDDGGWDGGDTGGGGGDF
jgi:hypothetical protein